MNQVNCPICGKKCVKSGKTKAGSQRWFCKSCKTSSTHKINNESKELQFFLQILLHRITDSASNGSVFPVVTEHFSASSDHAFL